MKSIASFVSVLVALVAMPCTVIALVGPFFGGHWGSWSVILFIVFGFIGMFAGAIASNASKDDSGSFNLAMALLLLVALAGTVAFTLSDLPERVSIFYVLALPLVVILIFSLRKRARR